MREEHVGSGKNNSKLMQKHCVIAIFHVRKAFPKNLLKLGNLGFPHFNWRLTY